METKQVPVWLAGVIGLLSLILGSLGTAAFMQWSPQRPPSADQPEPQSQDQTPPSVSCQEKFAQLFGTPIPSDVEMKGSFSAEFAGPSGRDRYYVQLFSSQGVLTDRIEFILASDTTFVDFDRINELFDAGGLKVKGTADPTTCVVQAKSIETLPNEEVVKACNTKIERVFGETKPATAELSGTFSLIASDPVEYQLYENRTQEVFAVDITTATQMIGGSKIADFNYQTVKATGAIDEACTIKATKIELIEATQQE